MWLIYRYGNNYICPKYQEYKIERTPLKPRLKHININDETLVVMESDILQQLYFICLQKQIKCNMDILYKIFERLDWLAWAIYYHDFNPTLQEFLSQIVTISNLSKMNISDVWINENFMFINNDFGYKDMLEKIRMIIHNEGDVNQHMKDLNLI